VGTEDSVLHTERVSYEYRVEVLKLLGVWVERKLS